ncbi:isocitrate lyase/PEP mutase family protein [Parasphingorhabdus cellanae]|uniref:Isocitrate lyase/PEP mutase family protein n=1 Tax=Parasphingorhabdus cellanae TaxID=2806553 RepID=A0ABX7T9E2_9SPHN|nr:isocitrate lyase/PEP mutase family protein [Parasphingorhabdus cellanae]QTD57442.1 isocitrate lyase/PEP mutase family protein [Parasphingorhabdus cellanae]
MTLAKKLRTRLQQREIVIAPGVYDALSAYRAEAAGFEAVFVSGSALAATHLARPDIGLLTASETAEIVARIGDRIEIPMLVDADQGFGNAFAVGRTVGMLERAGASAIQIEDQQEVKPANNPLSRLLISQEAMVDKIKAARDALTDADVLISARSDAMTTEGFERALERVHAYVEAGADMVFVESLTTRAQMDELVRQMDGKANLLHNLLRDTDEVTDAKTAQQIGYSVALFPGTALGAVGAALDRGFADLKNAPELRGGGSKIDRIGADAYLK